MHDTEGQARSLYTNLETFRQPYLDRAYDAAELTIPALLPRQGHTSSTKLRTPFQSVGARGVRNISSRMLLALFPPNAGFFKLVLDEEAQQQVDGSDAEQEIEAALLDLQEALMGDVERSHFRVAADEAIKHLTVTGNALIHWEKDKTPRVFPIDRFVVERDGLGKVLTIVTKEELTRESAPDNVRKALADSMETQDGSPGEQQGKAVELYTLIRWDQMKGEYTYHQEVEGAVVEGTSGSYSKEEMPWLPLRWHRISGESYGRGMVEELLGDLKSLEGLSQALLEGSAASSKMLFLVDPNGSTRIDTLAKAPNGAIRPGNADDVSTLQAEKTSDFRVVLESISRLEERLAFAFLMNSAAQRQAERVTAEEIRFMAQELEQALGATYSVLALDFQLPVVSLLMSRLGDGEFSQLLKSDAVRPSIITGLEALGRGHDAQRLGSFVQGLTQAIGPEQVARFLNMPSFIVAWANANSIDAGEMVKSQEQVAQEEQTAQLQGLVQQFGPQLLDAAIAQVQGQGQEQPGAQPTPAPAPQ